MKQKRNSALLICVLIAVSLLLVSCGGKETGEDISASISEQPTPVVTTEYPAETIVPTNVPTSTPVVTPTIIPTATPITAGLSEEQRNSIAMLNYLTMLTQEINASKNSRLFLENAYSSLVNNTNPEAVDQETEFRLEEILEQLKNYRMDAVKRERLEYIYETNKAQAIRAAVPSPLGLLSSTGSFNSEGEINWQKLMVSVAYMAVDSITSYQSASSEAKLQYLQDGWELDDTEYETLHRLRSRAFAYMIEMVQSNNLPGYLALNEEWIENFVVWKAEENAVRRIQLFEANRNVYEGFGPYWLTLADSFYANGDYKKCIDAIASYEALSNRIFRQDFELAKALPSALLSAMEVLDGKEYTAIAEHYLEQIEANAAFDDWSLRYFASQAYIDLYRRTGDRSYLEKAYALALNNVTLMVSEQLALNEKYLADVQTIDIPNGATKEKKKEIEQLNKQAEEERKTALIPVSEPLTLNCDLLFSIAEVLEINSAEQAKIESILHHNNQPLFLIPTIDNRYWFSERENVDGAEIAVSYADGVFKIPVQHVSDKSKIILEITSDNAVTEISDWDIVKVERKDKNDLSSFTVSFSSTEAKKHKFKSGDQLLFAVAPTGDAQESEYDFEFVAEEKTDWVVHHYLIYVRTDDAK